MCIIYETLDLNLNLLAYLVSSDSNLAANSKSHRIAARSGESPVSCLASIDTDEGALPIALGRGRGGSSTFPLGLSDGTWLEQ